MMFWKTARECHEVVEGYGSYKAASAKTKITWTEEQEHELRQLFEEHQDSEGELSTSSTEAVSCQVIPRGKWRGSPCLYELKHAYICLCMRACTGVSVYNIRKAKYMKKRILLYKLVRCNTRFISAIGDVVDCILENLINSTRTRRQIIRQLILMDLVTNSKQLKRGISGQVTWTKRDIDQLQEFYDRHKQENGRLPSLVCALHWSQTLSSWPPHYWL